MILSENQQPSSLKPFLLMSIAVIAIINFGLREVVAADSEKPNIVYIMVDELGYYELSCMGSPYIQTPRIDQMAAEGIRFSQALAGSSVCAPTRCVLMTGKHSGHTSVRVNGGGTPLRADEVTIATVLKERGYATGGFGKWGCGGRGSTGVPEKHGFDIFYGYYDQVHAHSYYPPYLIRNSEEVPLKGNKGMSTGETYSHYEIYNEGMNFIRKHKDEPFFCYMPFTPPHGLFDIPDEDPAWEIYRDKEWPEQAKRYAAMVTMIDRQVGEVLDLLKELKLEENTLVFFCGDNGGADYFSSKDHPRGFHGANLHPKTGVEFRGKKGNLYEGGIRIPMIARWPGTIEPGRESDLLWYFPDVFPTVAEFTGARVPDDIDGMSIVPELLGKNAKREQSQHEYLYWEIGSQTAVRMENWKLYRKNPKSEWELYNLTSDPSESKNIAAEHPDVLKKMQGFATAAHTPAEEGTFADQTLHQRDRRAKFGGKDPNQGQSSHAMPKKGLLKRDGMKLVSFSSESEFNQKFAANAIDGNPGTIWHTAWQGKLQKHPHELVIDLGKQSHVSGIRFLPRQDSGWNGTFGKVDVSVADSVDGFDDPFPGEFKKERRSQDFTFETQLGRFVRIRVLSEVTGGPWAAAAEIGIIGQPLKEKRNKKKREKEQRNSS